MSFRRSKSTQDPQAGEAAGKPKMSSRALAQVIERSSHIQGPVAEAYVARLRNASPGADPAEIVGRLEKRYVAVVTGSGAAVGGAATFPGIGTVAALSAAAGETVVFLEATALFVLAVASVYGIPLDERERRRALVLAVLVGDTGDGAVSELIGSGRTKGGWLSESMATLPLPALSKFNTRVLKYVMKRFAMKRGALMFGKLMPVGIGAIIGAVGNRMISKKIVRNAQSAFGPPPARWPGTLHLLPPVRDAS